MNTLPNLEQINVEDLQQGLHKRIEYLAEVAGDRIALQINGIKVTYRELHQRSNQLAHTIQTTYDGSFVATYLSDQIDQAVAIFAISKLVRSWIPINSKIPQNTVNEYLKLFDNAVVITDQDLEESSHFSVFHIANLPQDASSIPLVSGTMTDDHLMFFASTSGSTGVPKAVPRYFKNTYPRMIRPYSVTMFIGDIGSASYTTSIISILCHGSTVHMMDIHQYTIQDIHQYIRDENIIRIACVPSAFRTIFAHTQPDDLPSVEEFQLGAEAVLKSDFELFKRNFSPPTKLVHAMGITEVGYVARFVATHDTVITTDTVPIGKNPGKLDVYVVNEQGERVIGEQGEIHISGQTIVPYWNNPEASAKKFFPDPDRPGWTVFHSGDIGIVLEDGNLVHMGRKDFHITIRGHQVDLLTIENILASHPTIQHVAVQSYMSKTEPRLAVYFVPHENKTIPGDNEWGAYLAKYLPEYIIPTHFIRMDQLPTLANGKLDRRKLPDPSAIIIQRETPIKKPTSDTESRLLEIWNDILDSHIEISTDDSFFRLGGSSLQATALISEVNELFNVVLTPAVLFQNQSICELATLIDTGIVNTKLHPALIPFRPYGKHFPIFCFPGGLGNGLQFLHLAVHMGADYPIYGLEMQGIDGRSPLPETLDELISYYTDAIESLGIKGSIYLLGSSGGGVHAFEVAHRLKGTDLHVEAIIMIDSPFKTSNSVPTIYPDVEADAQLLREIRSERRAKRREKRRSSKREKRIQDSRKITLKRKAERILTRLMTFPFVLPLLHSDQRAYWREKQQQYAEISTINHRINKRKQKLDQVNLDVMADKINMTSVNLLRQYDVRPWSGNLIYVKASQPEDNDRENRWKEVVKGEFHLIEIDSPHTITNFPYVIQLAQALKQLGLQ